MISEKSSQPCNKAQQDKRNSRWNHGKQNAFSEQSLQRFKNAGGGRLVRTLTGYALRHSCGILALVSGLFLGVYVARDFAEGKNTRRKELGAALAMLVVGAMLTALSL
ncbi:MAG: hypothetical protein LBV80_00315 [Deltaproteobacteria bacterium]|jgi:hypothetical protein|nr:hypothetical protein [Deltaproteobacteria bacterium]